MLEDGPPCLSLPRPTSLVLSDPPPPPVSPSLTLRAETDCGPGDSKRLQIGPVWNLLEYLTFHDGVSGRDAQRLEDLPESVLGLVLLWEDEGGGLLTAVTHRDGGQELVEVGTPGCHLQPGGGCQQSGPPVDAHVMESVHDWTELRGGH